MRGYFGIGVENISKSGNLGSLMRSAHAFGASFFFTINDSIDVSELKGTDTSASPAHMPFYRYASLADMKLPRACVLVGVELLEDAVDLPNFQHPLQAAYILGPEKGSLSPEVISACKFTVKIPTKFCVNVGVAGALIMYDRLLGQRSGMRDNGSGKQAP